MQRRAVQPGRPLHYCTWINTHNTASSNQAATTDAGEAAAKAGSAGWRPLTEGIRLDKYTRSQPAEAEARVGPGFGAWANACLLKSEVSAGPVGIHVGPNLNTGMGVRDRNLDLHLLGSGLRLGADGLALDTPMGGAKCSVM